MVWAWYSFRTTQPLGMAKWSKRTIMGRKFRSSFSDMSLHSSSVSWTRHWPPEVSGSIAVGCTGGALPSSIARSVIGRSRDSPVPGP